LVKTIVVIIVDIEFIIFVNMIEREERIQAALAALRHGDVKSIRAASQMFNIPRTTLRDRLHGSISAIARQQSQQRLSVHEEQCIVNTIYTLDRWGWPMSIQWLESFTTSFLREKGDHRPLGHNWYLRFIERHEEIRTKWSRNRDQQRKDAEDPEVIQKWFQLYQDTKKQYGILDEDTYNVDEKGFMKGIGEEVKVIIPRREGEAISCQPGNREWVTVIEAVGINGHLLPSFVIFEGKVV